MVPLADDGASAVGVMDIWLRYDDERAGDGEKTLINGCAETLVVDVLPDGGVEGLMKKAIKLADDTTCSLRLTSGIHTSVDPSLVPTSLIVVNGQVIELSVTAGDHRGAAGAVRGPAPSTGRAPGALGEQRQSSTRRQQRSGRRPRSGAQHKLLEIADLRAAAWAAPSRSSTSASRRTRSALGIAPEVSSAAPKPAVRKRACAPARGASSCSGASMPIFVEAVTGKPLRLQDLGIGAPAALHVIPRSWWLRDMLLVSEVDNMWRGREPGNRRAFWA